MSRTYNLWTIGCQMNEADSRHLGSQLEALGYTHVKSPKKADLVVLNTCVVRQQAEDKAITRLTFLSQIKQNRPDMVIGLMGCMVGMREEKRLAKEFPFVDVFMPPSDTEPLLNYLEKEGFHDDAELIETREKAIRDAIQDGEHIMPAMQRGNAVIAHVPIVLGCSHACTFCVIPYRRGAERSRPPEEILREIAALTAQGVREIMLLGQIVDRYGCDLEEDYDLADLLLDVAKNEKVLRVRFLTSHPNWMSDRIIDAVASHDKLMPHFEVPIQAGNDKVLEDMKRGHTVAAYYELIDRIRVRVPDACINTDIIVGFPGETHEEFMGTYKLIDELQIDKIHLAKYSERPKTIAARKMPDDVSPEEKESRRATINDLNEQILAKKNLVWLDQEVEVLVESKQKDRWRGRTPHNRLVFFEDDRELTGALVTVKIHSAFAWSLLGDLTEIKVEPLSEAERESIRTAPKKMTSEDFLKLQVPNTRSLNFSASKS